MVSALTSLEGRERLESCSGTDRASCAAPAVLVVAAASSGLSVLLPVRGGCGEAPALDMTAMGAPVRWAGLLI